MKFKTLSNKIVSIDLLQKKFPLREECESRSIGQFKLGQLLCTLYSKELVFEEFRVPDEQLYLDFFIPKFSLAFEYDGKQHDQFNRFFHKLKSDFQNQIIRDQKKALWCKLNQIFLVRIPEQKLTLKKLKLYIIECQKTPI